jgi:hypothetical protein
MAWACDVRRLARFVVCQAWFISFDGRLPLQPPQFRLSMPFTQNMIHRHGQIRAMELASGTAVWFHYGKTPVPIRWVLIRDPHGELKRCVCCVPTQLSLCTRSSNGL